MKPPFGFAQESPDETWSQRRIFQTIGKISYHIGKGAMFPFNLALAAILIMTKT